MSRNKRPREQERTTGRSPRSETVDWAILACVCAVVITRVFSDMAMNAPVSLLCEGAMIVLAGVYVAAGVGRARLEAPALKVLIPIAAFCIVGLVSVQIACHKYAAWSAFLHFLGCLLVFALVAGLARTGSRRRFVVAALVATAAVAAGLGIDQYVVGLDKAEQFADAGTEAGGPSELEANLRGRFHDRRAFGPLDTPNALAGFLVLVFPLVLVEAMSALRRLKRVVLCAVAAALAAALVLTFSKAGWLVFGASAAAFGLWTSIRRRRRRATAALAVVVALAAALTALGITGVLPGLGLRRYVWSASARVGYWQATARMIAGRPVMGVGLGNFADHFFLHKTIAGEETRFAHNDYLQIAAETGLLGLAAFAALLAAWCWCALPRLRPQREKAGKPPRLEHVLGLWAAAAGIAFLFLVGPARALHPLLLAYVLPAWLVVAAGGWPTPLPDSGRCEPFDDTGMRAAAFFGAAGVLAHSAVDFHLYSGGLSFALWAVMALAIGPRGMRTYHVGTTARRVASLAALCLGLVLCWPPLVRSVRSESSLMRAEAARREPDWPAYMAEIVHAADAAPENPTPRAKLGLLMQVAARQAEDKGQKRLMFRDAAAHLLEAIELRPAWAAYQRWLADLYEEAAQGDSWALEDALPHARKAVELYPHQTRYRVALGRLYERLDQPGDAQAQYEAALDIDAAVTRADGPACMRLKQAEREAIKSKRAKLPQPVGTGSSP